MPFRFNCSSFGLTYSQSKLTTDIIYDWINANFSNYGILHLAVSHELHQDGNSHFHVACKLGRPFCSRDQRQWDINGEHPNLLRPRNYVQWVQYVVKLGNFKEQGTRPLSAGGSNRSPTYEEIVHKATNSSKLEFLCWASGNKVTYAREIWKECEKKPQSRKTILAGQPIPGVIDPKFQKCMLEVNWVQEKCLVLVGDSGIGKTTWAKQMIPKPALFVTHIDDLREFDPEIHKAILFDDVCFNHYPVQSQIHLVDYWDIRSIHIRYGTATIPAGIPKIFTCNEDPINLSHTAIQRRVQVVRCDVQTLRRFH